MDFFEHQARARRQTSVLVFYYILAVILIIAAVYAAFSLVFVGARAKAGYSTEVSRLWNPELLTWVVGCTLLVVAAGTVFKILQLSQGGQGVAQMLGGRPINRNSTDRDERKILNIVEEMAIAAGTTVPPVFLLAQEEGINAFAAGFSPGDAVIGVTTGCVKRLSRDELQGVVAHEFSHILNGDMRLNIRLIGVLNGILIIALIGYGVLRGTAGSRVRVRSRGKGGGGGAIVLFGLLLMIIGYVGIFFGKLIKSAVSRQREFLADASAVQFTRNPDGIGGALSKIAGFARGSRLQTAKAEEASHFFFSNGLAKSFLSLMSTHPPLEERIRRIDASLLQGQKAAQREAAPRPSAPPLPAAPDAAAISGFAIDSDEVVARVGAPRLEHLAYAMQLMSGLPDTVAEAVREPYGARAVIYALLLNREGEARRIQLEQLSQHADQAVYAETMKLAPLLQNLGHEVRLPLVDLAISALKELSESQFDAFRTNVDVLVKADKEIDLFEFALERMIIRHLEQDFRKEAQPPIRHKTVRSVGPACGQLLSCLAYWGTDEMADARAAFDKAVSRLQAGSIEMSPVDACGLRMVDDALDQLCLGSPAVKRSIIDACCTCIGSDGWVAVEEAELLRAIADSLDCPIPPFLPGALQ